MTHLTPEAKSALSKTIRELRARLLRDLHDEAEGIYRLSIRDAEKAGLSEAALVRRRRLEGWLDERCRAVAPKERAEARERFRREAEKETAHTLINRLVTIRHLEALGLSRPAVVTGGWKSQGYREFRDFAPGLCADPQDRTEGYGLLLQLVCDELAVDLPGLFGEVGLTRLFPVPASTLRAIIEALDAPELASAWTDDTTLGWVYQYWNDPEREALDAKIAGGGKVEPHEIASKTQMFTERYMVEWLLHNSLGVMWLAMCRKHGWTADAEAVLPALEERRKEWRGKRERGEVALDALMPIEGELEDRWKYYVPQPIPRAAVDQAPESVRKLKILDPACGSGHFLVIAFDLLAALYREEARHRGEAWGDREIAEAIVENNLHGVDIDPRAIQIAAAGLLLKVKRLSREARPKRMNLVAPKLELGKLPKDDPALVELRREIKREAGIPEEITDKIVTALKGVDHLGTLLKVDAAVEEAIRDHEKEASLPKQGELFGNGNGRAKKVSSRPPLKGFSETKATVLGKLERFLERRSGEGELGIRLDGEQLAAGIRFLRVVKEDTYDIVIGNPPYQGTSRMVDPDYVVARYPRAKADLYAVFLERGLEFARRGGLSALVTMRGWMFVGQYQYIREYLLSTHDLRTVADLGTGAFSSRSMDDIISASMTVYCKQPPGAECSVALQAAPLVDKTRDSGKPDRRRAALAVVAGAFEFFGRSFEAIEGEPVVYWWSRSLLDSYRKAQKLGQISPARFGLTTGDNARFVRFWHETGRTDWRSFAAARRADPGAVTWAPFVLGGKGRAWFEPLCDVCRWSLEGIEVKEACLFQYGTVSKQVRNESVYFRVGVAFSMIGNSFSARVHRFASVIGNMGSSVYPEDIASTLCIMNSATSKFVLESLNPGLHFEVGDVNRLPIFPVESADQIYATLDAAFTEHEAARESSVEFKRPGPSPWTYAQAWAQQAVDRPAGDPLSPYRPKYDPPAPESFVSFAFGVAMGRFGAAGEGLLDQAPPGALPAGILYLSAATDHDGLAHPATKPLVAAWAEHGAAIDPKSDLRTWLRAKFFEYHRKQYENRPIYFPLSSTRKNFVAWIGIHRWTAATLSTLLADHLLPERLSLEGQLADLRKARGTADKKQQAAAEKRFADVQKLYEELSAFVDAVTACAEKGPPPPDSATPAREVNARYAPDLDDGVMVNSAALWPLLDPQWKDPKKWWKELATARGRKDYDWSHLAARYFPQRADAKCKEDPSLAVAHGCFWKYHPARAYAWELRLQDEIAPDFRLDEPGSDEARARFLKDRAAEARDLEEKERTRRERKARKQGEEEEAAQGELFADQDELAEEADA